MIRVRQINSSEVGIIHDLAHVIWPPTFAEILKPEQIQYMLDWMYNTSTLAKQIAEGHRFFLIEDDGLPLGFMGIQPFYPDKASVKIHKLYVLPETQGKGLGKKLIDQAIEDARQNNCERLILNVNRFNRAVEFYKHIGFNILLEENIDIGNGYWMEDFVMSMQVN
jgi:GNAT superfamily N-acetyltransferase